MRLSAAINGAVNEFLLLESSDPRLLWDTLRSGKMVLWANSVTERRRMDHVH